MKSKIFTLVLFACIFAVVAQGAVTYKVLYTFSQKNYARKPLGALVLVNNALYGTGTYGVYKYDLATNTESVFASWRHTSYQGIGLMWDGQNFYGATQGSRTPNCGEVFRISPGGSLTVLHTFTGGSDGCNPTGAVAEDAQGNLYGSTSFGGLSGCQQRGCGTVYQISAGGTFSVLHAFTDSPDGANPYNTIPLFDSNGNLFGVTASGGANGEIGAIYEITKGGTYSIVYSFTIKHGSSAQPGGITIDANNTLYGALWQSSAVFSFTSSGQESETPLLAGAEAPYGVTLDATGNLYVITSYGGKFGHGELVKISGGTQMELHSFSGKRAGGAPFTAVVFDSSGALYGTCSEGGIVRGKPGAGVIFKMTQ